ncbi:MAG TPA: hypothetical protein GXX17_01375 [Clostridiales bacterium]|nr:hypothetical protein [Clostridiales bacterium]
MTTTLMVQTDRIFHNLKVISQRTGGANIIPVLSANAFGLGDVALARLLFENGYTLVAVSRIEEALRLSEINRNLRILILTPYSSENEIRIIVENDFIATIGSNDCAVLLSGIARQLNKTASCHIKFDMGSDNSGYLPYDAKKAAQTLKYLSNLSIEGVYSTLSGKLNEKAARQQYRRFVEILNILSKQGINYGIAHLCSTSSALKFPWAKLDAVRVGEGLCGILSIKDKYGLKRVGRLVSEIADIRWVNKGFTVGAQRIKIKQNLKVATVPVGYADGLFTGGRNRFSLFGRKKAFCEIAGRRATIIGKPGYTTTLIDVTNLECKPSDQVSFEVVPLYVNQGVRREYV